MAARKYIASAGDTAIASWIEHRLAAALAQAPARVAIARQKVTCPC